MPQSERFDSFFEFVAAAMLLETEACSLSCIEQHPMCPKEAASIDFPEQTVTPNS
jgi:hypothetical protein